MEPESSSSCYFPGDRVVRREEIEEQPRRMEPGDSVPMDAIALHPDARLDELERMWNMEGIPGEEASQTATSLRRTFDMIVRNFGIEEDPSKLATPETLDRVYDSQVCEIFALKVQMLADDVLEDAERVANLKDRFSKLLEIVYYGGKLVRSANFCTQVQKRFYSSVLNGDSSVQRFACPSADSDDATAAQKLLLYMFDSLRDMKLRKYEGQCYEQIFTPEGFPTMAWRPVMTVEEMLYSLTQKDVHFDRWKQVTAGKENAKFVVDHLTKCNDPDFPKLCKNRHLFSFRNGLYDAESDAFYSYGERAFPDSNVASAKYFDLMFDDGWYQTPEDIPTPCLDSIFKYQELDGDILHWIFVLIGRMLYDVREHDDWQVMPFLKGQAGAGKCFARGTMIMMADGRSTPVEKVRIGDKVMGDDSSPREVLTLHGGFDDMYRVCTPDGKTLYEVNGRHILCLVSKKDGSFRETSVTEFLALSPSEAEEFAVYRAAGPVVFRPIDSEFDAYATGYWLAEPDALEVRVPGGIAGLTIFDALDAAMRLVRGQDSDRGSYFHVTKARFVARFRVAKEAGRVDDGVLFGSVATREAALAGIVDSAGRVLLDETGEPVGYAVEHRSEAFAKDVLFLFRSLGMTADIAVGYVGDTSAPHRVQASGATTLPCKKYRWTQKLRDPSEERKVVPVDFKIDKVRKAAYFGFQTDGNGKFLLESFDVVHNSTVALHVIKGFYEATDVGILSNNVERKFGLSAFYDKFVFLAPEVTGDFQLEQAEFQSMVSGEDMSIAVKHKTARSMVWKAAGMMCSNTIPGWADNGGSLGRRIVIIEFTKMVREADGQLGKKLEHELPRIVLKCNRMYRRAAEAYGTKNIWNHLPPYFSQRRKELSENTNGVMNFMASGKVRFGSDLYVIWGDFLAAYNLHVASCGFKKQKVSTDTFRTPFEANGVKWERDTRRPWPPGGPMKRGNYLVGMCLADEDDGDP